jgi:hypothetical protein
MMNSAIKVENISKLYRIGVNRPKCYRILRESISAGLVSLYAGLRRPESRSSLVPRASRTHWALKDVSSEFGLGVYCRQGKPSYHALQCI